jgi:hypothetical protein
MYIVHKKRGQFWLEAMTFSFASSFLFYIHEVVILKMITFSFHKCKYLSVGFGVVHLYRKVQYMEYVVGIDVCRMVVC